MKEYPLVSICTCVYNGANTIYRVFESMKNLDYPNIEHIIVNDGSTDKTEELVREYIGQVSFPVKYHKKENGGKHTAMNVAWELAEGMFLLGLDADDELLPDSVRFLVDTYYSIPEAVRDQYWCVHGRCITQHGEFVGDKYPEDINAQHWIEAGKEASRYAGEKAGLKVRKYLDAYRFPEVEGVSHIAETIIWKQINRQYGTWYTNKVVRVYYVGEGGNLTAVKTKRKQYAPACYSYKWRLMHPQWYGRSFNNLARYSLTYFISDKKFRKHNPYLKNLEQYRIILSLLCLVTYPGAYIFRKLKRVH